MILAIVGSRSLAGNTTAVALISKILDYFKPDEIVTGGAEGIDIMAAAAAKARGIKVTEFFPKQKRWAPFGYAARNTQIVSRCHELVYIGDKKSKTYGSGWTRDLADKRKKPTWSFTIDGTKITGTLMEIFGE